LALPKSGRTGKQTISKIEFQKHLISPLDQAAASFGDSEAEPTD
jgi:hypothetical protein